MNRMEKAHQQPYQNLHAPTDSCIRGLMPGIHHHLRNKESLYRAIEYTLDLYRSVMELEHYEAFIHFLRHNTPPFVLFVDPSITKDEVKHFPFVASDIPNYPAFGTQYPYGKIGSDRVKGYLTRLKEEGYIAFPQSPASMLPYWLVRQQIKTGAYSPGDELRLLDLCGAPGNKLFNYIHLPGISTVTAVLNDIKEERLGRVIERLNEFGFARERDWFTHEFADGRNVRIAVHHGDAANPDTVEDIIYRYFNGRSPGLINCDVPCSQDGRIVRRPSSAVRKQPKSLHDVRVEIAIAQNAIDYITSGEQGLVVYSTCSVNPWANEAVIAEVMKSSKVYAHTIPYDNNIFFEPSAGRAPISGRLEGVRTYPHIEIAPGVPMTDGFYACLLGRI